MKKVILGSTFVFCLFVNVPGQTAQYVTVRNNKVSVAEIRPECQQIFPDFRMSRLFYKGLAPISCQANYNFLLDEIHYIDEKGEVMAVSNPSDLLRVEIDDRIFIFTPKGFVEIIEQGEVLLVYKWTCRIRSKSKEGAYGISTDSPGIYQMNRISFDSKEWNMQVDENAITFVEVTPYLMKNRRLIAVKGLQGFTKAFHEKKSLVRQYVQRNRLDLNKEMDLRRMINYANSL